MLCSNCGEPYNGRASGETFTGAFLSLYYNLCPKCVKKAKINEQPQV